VIRSLAETRRGLILVTGPTGSGKTTTIATLLGFINRTRRAHIVTIEDPIEVIFTDAMSVIRQREVGRDTESYGAALRQSLRQDPDVIFLGEIRDPETALAAIQAAQTGHLVLSTMHTIDAPETISRIVEMFPPAQQAQMRVSVARRRPWPGAGGRGHVEHRSRIRPDPRSRARPTDARRHRREPL
jgi:twitching motility protein PilT